MPEALGVLLLALAPPGANFVGGLLAEVLPISKKALNRALHAAAGIVIAVVAVEIMPMSLEALPAWALALAFLTGGVLYVLVNMAVRARSDADEGSTRMWMIYLAVATDLFGDSLLLGAGAAVGIGPAVAAGLVLADMPEGFASILTFKENDVPRRRRLLLSASFFLPALTSAGSRTSCCAARARECSSPSWLGRPGC